MKITLPPQPSPEKLAVLAKLRGTFKMGHTDGDARAVLGQIERLTGITFAILWDFNDFWGLGGNSCMVFIDQDGRLRETPEGWWDFLYEPESPVEFAELFTGVAGNAVRNWQRTRQSDEHNYFWREVAGEAD